jgi:hypothetical protein
MQLLAEFKKTLERVRKNILSHVLKPVSLSQEVAIDRRLNVNNRSDSSRLL